MATVVIILMISVGTNVLLYAVIALFLWPIAQVTSKRSSVVKEKE